MDSVLFLISIPIVWIYCYLIGSIPFSYIFARVYGVNLLQVGTKNPGGTNAWRNVNPLAGISGGIGDVLKGTFGIWPSLWISNNYFKSDITSNTHLDIALLIIGSGIAVVLGHQKSLVLRYVEGRWLGGKGMGTFGGILLAFSVIGFLILFVLLMGVLQIPKKLFKLKTNLFGNVIVAGASIPIIWILTNNIIFVITIMVIIVMLYIADQNTLNTFTSKVSKLVHSKEKNIVQHLNHTDSSLNFVDTEKTLQKHTDEEDPPMESINNSPMSHPNIPVQQEKTLSLDKDKIIFSLKDYLTLIKITVEDLEYWESYINSINVFPVPDGDTGTNMVETFRNMLAFSIKLTTEITSQEEEKKYFKMILDNIIISGLGNSGLIFTQWFQGVLDICYKNKGNEPKIMEIDAIKFKSALKEGYIRAFNSMQDPKEGTILTLMRVIAELDIKNYTHSLQEYFLKITESAFENLKNTSRGIKKLVGVKVIDAGALCFAVFINALVKTLFGKGLIRDDMSAMFATFAPVDYSDIKNGFIAKNGDIFCLQFTIESNTFTVKELQLLLEPQGTAIKISQSSAFFRIHIHTPDPNYILSQIFGEYEIRDLHLDNMREQIQQQILKHR